jgi:hypothetical protein
LKESLKESEPKRRNQVLKRAVFGDNYSPKLKNHNVPILETYLREYTSAFDYWKDLTISFEPVSMKERDNVITFTHHGLNGNFEPELSIPHINTPDNLFEES